MIKHLSKHTLLVLLAFSPAMIMAQAPAAGEVGGNEMLGYLVIIFGIIVFVAAMYTILRVLGMMLKLEEIRLLREKGLEEVAAHYEKPQKPLLSRLWTRMQGAVPVAKEKDIMFDHAYDGIRELDNKLPPWWVGMFYITIAIAAVYLYVYHVSDIGLSSSAKYEKEMEQAEEDVAAFLALQADQIDESNVELLVDEAELAVGESIYKAQCAVCHGQLGEGGVGPNFTDEYWVHGGDIKDLFRTIKYGVPEKGMISWKEQLRASEMQQVASYILTLQGTDPPNQKAPEGEIWNPPAEAMLQDTTATGD